MNEPLQKNDRAELINMPDDPDPIPVGTKGTCVHVGMISPTEAQYGMKWDNGRTLALLEGIDSWKKL